MIGYKGLKNNLKNYQNNCTYELNKWYRCLEVDPSNKDCSYGLHLCFNPEDALEFGSRVFKCIVPEENNIIVKGTNKFRCLKFFLTDEEVEFDWDKLTKSQRYLVCHNSNFNYEKYWSELTGDQRAILINRVVIKE